MPAAVGMTLEDTITEVLARCGQMDDGVANPLLTAEATAHINAAQRALSVEMPHLRQRRIARISLAAGQRFCDLPADAMLGQITAMRWIDGDNREPMLAGIDRTYQGDTGTPERYDMTPSTGIVGVTIGTGGSGYTGSSVVTVSGGTRDADGHDPVFGITLTTDAITGVTVTDSGSQWSEAPTLTPDIGTSATLTAELGNVLLCEVWPVPADAGQIEVTYIAGVERMTDDTDRLALDDEAVIGRAAWLLANTKGLGSANGILQAHTAYLSALRVRGSPGATSSLSSFRTGQDARSIPRARGYR